MKNQRAVVKNIYYMLAYAFRDVRMKEEQQLSSEAFTSMHNLFAAILAHGIGRQLKRGLHRAYVPQTETLTTLRGKINLPESMKQQRTRRQALTCDYDALSENNLLNQILKTTVFLLLRHADVAAPVKSTLKKEMMYFSDVDVLPAAEIRWSALSFHRNNRSYRLLIGICRLVLEGMLLTEADGSQRLARFVDDQHMYQLYEKFLLAYFRRHWPQLTVKAAKIDWALDDGHCHLLPEMRSDITLAHGDNVLIIDAKWYAHILQGYHGEARVRSAHLYQIFAYVKNMAAGAKSPHFVAGMLLYAATDDCLLPNETYQMSGNAISVHTLDMNRDFVDIAAQLDAIVEQHFGLQVGGKPRFRSEK